MDTSNRKPGPKHGKHSFGAVQACRASQSASCTALKSDLQAEKVENYNSFHLVVARVDKFKRGRKQICSCYLHANKATDKRWSHLPVSPLDGTLCFWSPQVSIWDAFSEAG